MSTIRGRYSPLLNFVPCSVQEDAEVISSVPTPPSPPPTYVHNQAEYIPSCSSDDDCLAAIRTLGPKDSSSNDIGICDCYALSRINPLDECEGKQDCMSDQSCGNCEEATSVCLTGRCILAQDRLEDETPSPTYDVNSGAGLSSVLVTAAVILLDLLIPNLK